jgi:peptidyl-prolyl cis-trans isomerase B (cyclophilin B)
MASNRRRERMETEQQEARSMRRGMWIVGAVAALLVIVTFIVVSALRSDQALRLLPRANRASSAGLDSTAGSDPCAIFPKMDGAETEPPQIAIDTTKDYSAFIVTSKGTVNVDLFANVAPINVNNFMFLSCNRFYDNVAFHRVVPGYLAHGGDPFGTGKGGTLYYIQDEFAQSVLTFDRPGLVAMWRTAGFNTASSQFFITLADTAQTRDLTGRYTIFGEVADEASLNVAKSLTPNDPDSPASTAPDTITTIIIRQMN